MGIKRNIILSFVIHASLITVAAGFVTVRDAVFRVPEKIITVVLLEGLGKEPPSPAASKTEPSRKTMLPEVPPRNEDTAPAKQKTVHEQKSSPVTHSAGAAEGQTIAGAPIGVGADAAGTNLSPGSGMGDASALSLQPFSTGKPLGGEGAFHVAPGPRTGDADVTGIIRAAIERAKSYPLQAKKRGTEGTATAEFTINSKGYPENIRIVQSSGSDILDAAAKKTIVRASPFPPVRGRIEVPITFRLKKGE